MQSYALQMSGRNYLTDVPCMRDHMRDVLLNFRDWYTTSSNCALSKAETYFSIYEILYVIVNNLELEFMLDQLEFMP